MEAGGQPRKRPAVPAVLPACVLYLLLGLISGHVLATGQAEPLRWLSASLYFTAVLAWAMRRSGTVRRDVEAALLSGLAVGIFCGVAGRYWNFGHAALLAFTNLVLLFLFRQLFGWKRGAPFLLGLVLLAGLLLPQWIYWKPLQPPSSVPRSAGGELTILTSLPIGPFGEGNVNATLSKPVHPAFARLSRSFTVHFADSLETAPRGRLLLAHPRALHPADLAAIDTWVRQGGKAVILADPLLAWPSDLSPSDSRRPPITSLLDPLLTHWGLRLQPAGEAMGVVQQRLANGRLLAMISPGHFTFTGTGTGPDCRLEEQGVIADCRIGDGRAFLVADADMLHPTLWLGGNGNWPAIDRDRPSDNMLLLLQWLGTREENVSPRTGWILANRDICYGLLAAIAAILLAGLAGNRVGRDGNRRERRVI